MTTTFPHGTHICVRCGARVELRDGVVTVPHEPACPVLKNPLLILARGGAA